MGLVCSHVWLGHFVAHSNDPNWESGLSFRVTDRLTGLWGMWPGGTLLLSGPAYQLAAYRSGHLSARISPQMENDLLFPPKLCMEKIFCLASCAFEFLDPKVGETCNKQKILTLLSKASKLVFKDFSVMGNSTHLTWEVSVLSAIASDFHRYSAEQLCPFCHTAL